MIYLNAEQVLFIHARVVSATGGSHGVRDLGLLQSALARPSAAFEGNEMYPDVFSKAAALMHSLIKNHPFLDGNKRTSIVCAGIFLRLNGWKLTVPQDDLVAFVLDTTIADIEIDELAQRLRSISVPV